MISAPINAHGPDGAARRAEATALDSGACRIVAATVRAGALSYRRERHLGGLIGVAPDVVADRSPDAAELILTRLRRALRAERRRARAGHWTYDINRHIALRQAYRAELALVGRGGDLAQAGKRMVTESPGPLSPSESRAR